MVRRATGFGLAALPMVQAQLQSQESVRFQQALRRGAASPAAPLQAAYRATASVFHTGEAFTPEYMAQVYGHDAAWAGSGRLIDGRVAGKCGGGGCNAPSCAWQYWDVGVPCNPQNLQAYMFQLPRYVWAQQRMHQLWSAPPTPWHLITNHEIADKAVAWGVWLSEAYKALALLRWAVNVRWELIASKLALPFEPPYVDSRLDMRARTARDPLLQRFLEELRVNFGGSGIMSGMMDSPLSWAYSQAGQGYDPDCRPWKVNTGDHGTVNELAWALKVPSSAEDFAPRMGRWGSLAPPSLVDRDGARFYGYEYQCGGDPGYMNIRPARGVGLGQLLGLDLDLASLDPQALTVARVRRSAEGRQHFDRVKVGFRSEASYPYTEGWCSPLMQVLSVKTRLEAYMNLQFGDAVSAGLSAWSEMILAQPELFRGSSSQSLEALQQGIMQAQLNEAAGYVGAGFGAAATLATTFIPQPYGAIVGAVIAVIGAIVTALMGAAYDLGLARVDRPPCPAPPLLRMIDDPNTGACDFDAARRGVEEVLGKSNAIVTMVGMGVTDPEAWYPVLEALSTHPMDPEPPVLPAPDVVAETPTWQYVAGGLAVGAVGLGLMSLFTRK